MEYALTADHHRVHAFDAEKGQEYYCPGYCWLLPKDAEKPVDARIKSGKYIGYSEKYKKPGKKNATDGLEGKA